MCILYIHKARGDFDCINGKRFVLRVQAQVEDFEKRLTAVHTKGLENVEGEESQPQVGDTQSQNFQTPQPQKNKRKTTRGDDQSKWISANKKI